MIAEAGLGIPIFTVDTGRLLPETHDLIERTSARYGVNIAVYCPNSADVELMVKRDGVNLFRNSAFEQRSSAARPARRSRSGAPRSAWTSGSASRATTAASVSDPRELAEWDASAGLVTIDPLATWDEAAVWDYVRAHDVPYNPLHDQGFETIDCAPCALRA